MRVTSTCETDLRFGFSGQAGVGAFLIASVPNRSVDELVVVTDRVLTAQVARDYTSRTGDTDTISSCVVEFSDITIQEWCASPAHDVRVSMPTAIGRGTAGCPDA